MSAKHLIALIAVWGIFIALPFAAPVLMHLGFEQSALQLYRAYGLLCHQLPQRSYFLFGPSLSYEIQAIQAAANINSVEGWQLRQFIGSDALGWKVAWSDRMVSFYGGMWLWGFLWLTVPAMRVTLRWSHLMLFTLPILLDGGSHMVSDIIYGIGNGFRDHNQWLVTLTSDEVPWVQYAGDGLGTVNSTLRLATGLLFSFGLMNWVLPLVYNEASRQQEKMHVKTQ